MAKKNKRISLQQVLKNTEESTLHLFLIQYAKKDKAFESALLTHFGSQPLNTETRKAYVADVVAVFDNNMLESNGRYGEWDEAVYAQAVSAELQKMLEKVDHHLQHKNYEKAMMICQALIETLPEKYEPDFDYDGEVEAVYDDAIDKLRKMMDQQLLSIEQKQQLFKWFNSEQENGKYTYIGQETGLRGLEEFFIDTPEMLQQNLANIENRIKGANPRYGQQRAVMDKIRVLQKAGMEKEAEKNIRRYIRFHAVRELLVERLLKQKQYGEAIKLIEKGIKNAVRDQERAEVTRWKKTLLDIYETQKDRNNILALAEELLTETDGDDGKAYYKILKKYTPKDSWGITVERVLSIMDNDPYLEFNSLKADIYIEHKMWERLFLLCDEEGVYTLEDYEKYLRPLYDEEILATYYEFVESQALITRQQAYDDIARILQKMKKFKGGKVAVSQLLRKYRQLYKRRKNMMKALDQVNG